MNILSLDFVGVRGRARLLSAIGGTCMAVLTLPLAGCSKTADAPTTTSESPAANDAASVPAVQSETVSTDPPAGGMLMPEGVAPQGEADQPAKSARGFEMPPGVVPPGPEAGNNASTDSAVSSENDSALEPSTASGASGAEPATVQYASWGEIEKMATTTERITVVDLWSLSCEPCLKEFPGLVRLKERFGDSVTCVGVDVDFDGRKTRPPEHYEPNVTAFLASVNADFPNYISRTPSDEVFAQVEIVSIPAVLVFDASGKLVKKFFDGDETAGFTYDKDIIPLVEKLAQ